MGFSLLEVLLTIVIIGILSAIIYPAYSGYVVKVHRSSAIAALYDAAGRLEEYYMQQNNTYKGATISALQVDDTNYKNYYQLDLTIATSTAYTIQAQPIGAQQQNDKQCGVLRLDQDGARAISGVGTIDDCWF